jgi:hypothetical protein
MITFLIFLILSWILLFSTSISSSIFIILFKENIEDILIENGIIKMSDVDCVGSWGAWRKCSALCGGGAKARLYNVSTPKSGNGTECLISDREIETALCNTHLCAADLQAAAATDASTYASADLQADASAADLQAVTYPLPAGFAESYAVTGCADPEHCGTFHRIVDIAAVSDIRRECATTKSDWCKSKFGTTNNPTMCYGAPMYQKDGDDGPVMYRFEDDNITNWSVSDSSALETCSGQKLLYSLDSDQLSGPPTDPAYSTGINWFGGNGWIDIGVRPGCYSDCGINVIANGR